MKTRTLIYCAGLLLLSWAFFSTKEKKVELRAETIPATDARDIGERLLRDYPDALDVASQSEIAAALKIYDEASNTAWLMGSTRTSLTSEQLRGGLATADRLFQDAAHRMVNALDRVPGTIHLPAGGSSSLGRAISMPFPSAVLVLHRGSSAENAALLWKRADLSSGEKITLDIPDTRDFICVLEILHPSASLGHFRVDLVSATKPLVHLDWSVSVPPQVPLRVEIRDNNGRPTEAGVGLYSTKKRLLVPAGALDFSAAGYNYRPVNYRDHVNARFWPGEGAFARCFFIRGGFTINVPAGDYRLIATRGPEYLAVDRSFSVSPGRENLEDIRLQRWIDMSSRGWHSGDTHIHYARTDREANQRLLLWTLAEDLQVGNILRMGDARETYFEQYAFGKSGRFLYDNSAFVPGQEDPRTGVLGHTISLNIQAPIRDAQRDYYLYGTTFDQAHKQGGLSGYAHVNTDSFLVHRDMTLNIPREKADFAEICEFGEVGTKLYYEFLNLGFQLTAVGGSDAPWGGTVGDSRVYVYTGQRRLDPDQWFPALSHGRTFVTTGPMLDFTINGRFPGAELSLTPGGIMKVHARALGSPTMRLGNVEIVANGDVIRSAAPSDNSAALDFELPVSSSMWIAARVAGAHSTPIYVTVNGKRHWKVADVPALLDKRLSTLDEIDLLIDQHGASIGSGQQPEWENREAFRRGEEQLRNMVSQARNVYLQLRKELQANQ